MHFEEKERVCMHLALLHSDATPPDYPCGLLGMTEQAVVWVTSHKRSEICQNCKRLATPVRYHSPVSKDNEGPEQSTHLTMLSKTDTGHTA